MKPVPACVSKRFNLAVICVCMKKKMQITQSMFSLQFWSLRFKLYNAVIYTAAHSGTQLLPLSYLHSTTYKEMLILVQRQRLTTRNSEQLEFQELSGEDTLRNNKRQSTGILWQLKQLLALSIHWQLKQIRTCLRLTIPTNIQLLLWSSRTVRDSCLELWINQKCKKLFFFVQKSMRRTAIK